MLDQRQWTPSLCLANSFTIGHWLTYIAVINQAPGKVFCRKEEIYRWVRNSYIWFLHWSANFIKISTSHHLLPNLARPLPVLIPILTFTSLTPVHLDSCSLNPPPSPHLSFQSIFHSPSKCSVPYKSNHDLHCSKSLPVTGKFSEKPANSYVWHKGTFLICRCLTQND